MGIKETHDAIVTRNVDDDIGLALRGAVFFTAPTLLDGEYPQPAVPCFQFASANGAGLFFIPKVNDKIEVELITADPRNLDDTSDVEVPEPRYKCMVYSEDNDIDEEFKKNYPFRMGWRTNSGHLLLFDDKEKHLQLSLLHASGHLLRMTDFKPDSDDPDHNDKERDLELIHADGHALLMTNKIKPEAGDPEQRVTLGHLLGFVLEFVDINNATERFLRLFHPIGNFLKWDKEGTETYNIVKDALKTIGGDETTTTTGDRTHTAANHILDTAGDNKLGSSGAAENLVLGVAFQTLYNAHTHIGNLGVPSGNPLVPMGAAQLAARNFTELG